MQRTEKKQTRPSLASTSSLSSALPPFSPYFPPAVAQVYIVSFRSNDDRRPSKFIVLEDNMRAAINIAQEKGGPDFQVRFDKFTGQAQEMKERSLRIP